MKTKIYLAGKITGDPNYREKFKSAARVLTALGYVVLNPAILPDGLSEPGYMRISLTMLEESDMTVFLPDFQESKGALIEQAWCQRTGKPWAMYEDFIEANKKKQEEIRDQAEMRLLLSGKLRYADFGC